MAEFEVEITISKHTKVMLGVPASQIVMGSRYFAEDLEDVLRFGHLQLEVWATQAADDADENSSAPKVFEPYTLKEIGTWGPGEMIHRLSERFPILCSAHGRWSDEELKIALMTVTQDWPKIHPQLKVKDNPQA